jgi:hypothetical protein
VLPIVYTPTVGEAISATSGWGHRQPRSLPLGGEPGIVDLPDPERASSTRSVLSGDCRRPRRDRPKEALDTHIRVDVLRGEAVALAWLEPQQNPRISVITWLEAFLRLPLDDAILLTTARCRDSPWPAATTAISH